MKNIKLEGLDNIIKEKNNTIQISPADEFSKRFISKKADIRIEILEDGEVVNGTTTNNLIRGLIVCSNHYLPDTAEIEEMYEIKTKLERAVRKGAEVTIKRFGKANDRIHLAVNIKGENKYNFYLDTLAEILEMVEETNKKLQLNSL